MDTINELHLDVLAAMSGAEKLKALLRSRGLDLTTFAERHNHWSANVSRCIHGKQHRPEIRRDLAQELGLEREQIDALIDGAESPTTSQHANGRTKAAALP